MTSNVTFSHAPGPWHVEPLQWDHGASIAICNRQHGVLAVINPLNDAEDAASASRDPCDYPNAYLMAAAPEMLDALLDAETEICELLEDLCSEPEEDISAQRTLAVIRAAIAKARWTPGSS